MKAKTVVITGSSRGIGRGVAENFLKGGHQVVLNSRSEEGLAGALKDLKAFGSLVCGVAGSVCEVKTHEALIEKALGEFGIIDIWINNAGIPQGNKIFTEIEPDYTKKIVETNVSGLILGSQCAARAMKKQGHGKIFNMEGFGSDGRMMKNLTLYGTTKRAVHYFTKSAAKELQGSPVQMGVLSPGMVRTDFITQSMEQASEEEKKRFQKVYDILAEDVEKVSPFLVEGMLKSSKNYDRIEFLSKWKLMGKIIQLIFK